jgi:hypothetical protein
MKDQNQYLYSDYMLLMSMSMFVKITEQHAPPQANRWRPAE